MSLLSATWWGSCVQDLRTRALSTVASRYRISEEALIEALIEADPGGPAQDAPWWPEALRARAHTPLRALARRFGTEPRRLRRALAREGLRAGGRELRGAGDPALAAWRARLGQEPDATIAQEAGVSVEAVQGERRRLGLQPFHPGAALRLTPDEEAWIRGPEPVRRVRQRPDAAAVLEVVRRPRSAVDVPRRPGGGERPPAAPPHAPVAPRVAAEPPPAPAPAGAPVIHRVSPDFFRAREPRELDRLLQPAPSARDGGHKRIVRIEPPRAPSQGPPTAQLHPRAARPAAAEPAPSVADTSTARAVPQGRSHPILPAPSPAAAPPPAAAPSSSHAPLSRAPVSRAPLPRATPDEAAAAPLVWHVHVPGALAPLVIEADSVWSAARLAAPKLPPDLWPQVAVVLAEEDARALRAPPVGAVLAWEVVPTFG